MRRPFPTLLSLLLLAPAAPAQERPPRPDPISPHVRGAWEEWVASAEGSLEPDFDPASGLLRSARGALRLAPDGLDRGSVGAASRLAVRRLAPLVGVRPETLVERGSAEARGGLFQVRYAQELAGVPVLGAKLELRWSAAGDLVAVSSRGLVPGAPSVPPALVTSADAAELARVALPGSSPQADPRGPELVLSSEDGGRLVWLVGVHDPALSPPDWHVLVDATSGVVLRAGEAVVHGDVSGKAEGWGTPAGTMELADEAKIALSRLKVRATDFSSALLKISADELGEEALVAPDGSRVFWTTRADGDLELWTALTDGTGALQLTSDTADAHGLATDYSGSAVFFASDVTGDEELWVVNADGSGLTQLTSSPGADREVSVTRDGATMVWASDRDGDFELYRADTSGSGLVQLTHDVSFDGSPRIAGDGGKIAWLHGPAGDAALLWVMEVDGSAPTQLVFGAGRCAAPSISNDGATVLFERWRRGEARRVPGTGGTGGIFGGPRELTPTVWRAATDGAGLASLAEGIDAWQVDPFLAGGGTHAVWSERNAAGELDLVHVELATLARMTVPADGDQTGGSLSDDGLVSTYVGGAAWRADWRTVGGSQDVETGTDGSFTFSYPDGSTITLEARLAGEHVRVDDDHPSQKNLFEVISATAPATGANILFNDPGTDPLKTPQVTGYVQHERTHDYLEAAYLGLGYSGPFPFDGQLVVNVNDPAGTRNAYYSFLTNESLFFVGSGPTVPNTCFDTVCFHEYGHFVDEWFGRSLGLGGLVRAGDPREHSFGVSEGLADWVAMLTSSTGVIGAGWSGPGTWIRNYTKRIAAGGSSDRQWDCLDCKKVKDFYNGNAKRFEPHLHGEALAGFAFDLLSSAGAAGEQILLDTLGLHPSDMREAVAIAFDVDLVFNGGANFEKICRAARRHGFDCLPRPDFPSDGCALIDWCGSSEAKHRDTGLEKLGFLVDPEPACEFPADDEDGLDLPHTVLFGGESVLADLWLSVDPDLLASGRYGGLKKDGKPNPLHYLYVNVWLLVDYPTGKEVTHILGTGSGNPCPGSHPPGFAADTFAIDPDAEWGGLPFESYAVGLVLPAVDKTYGAILRVRLDYGEDGGRGDLKALNPSNDPLYDGDCGPSRSGEVEDYQIAIVPLP